MRAEVLALEAAWTMDRASMFSLENESGFGLIYEIQMYYGSQCLNTA